MVHRPKCKSILGHSDDFLDIMPKTQSMKQITDKLRFIKIRNFSFAKENVQRMRIFSDWCGLVDWVLAFEPKGCRFNSQSGYTPGLPVRSPVRGAQKASSH